ncbi:serine hydrolase [Flavobacteriaceae bacterium TP-CH-4]|uniref:Serine hydrolase n=1 Tax=Pelagihabitans pacificus TaxID=2696054 RepID=A0A967AUD8_9FLAO|nr:serine hydrolase [Pelagihabitans pacificus]NHF57777.1 serine hydrolase [Pelagihabitans pacificus]
MRKSYLSLFFSLLFAAGACDQSGSRVNPIEEALASENPNIKRVMDSIDRFEVQIRYTQIDRRNDSILFTDYDFQVNERNYFYPASTVKFPTAVLALEHLNQTDTLDRNTRFYVEGDSVETTFATAVSQIFAVSDNEANNRLLEFLGQDAINETLLKKGIFPVRISHRLGYHTDDVTTKPLIVYLNDSTTATTKPTINSVPEPLQLNKIQKGIGYYTEDELVEEPFDFSLKNYYPINAQHALMKRVIFPGQFDEKERFDLSQQQWEFLLSAMHTLPREVGYDPEEYYDGYCKFFIYGDTKDTIPNYIKIYNKVGFAYGTLTDCAYITDAENDVEFLLTATILVNKDGVFNDDKYEYEEVGIPFLAELGREIYSYELNRKK